MHPQYDNSTLIGKLQVLIMQRLDSKDREQLSHYAALYFRFVVIDELQRRASEDLFAAFLAHWKLVESYHYDKPQIRLYNPTLEGDGWHSSHTVLDLVVEDRPFLLQSIAMEFNQQGLTNHLIIHPIITLADHNLALIHIEFDRQSDPKRLTEIKEALITTLNGVVAATDDHLLMLERLQEARKELLKGGQPFDVGTGRESATFLGWLEENHFVFLGFRRYRMVNDQGRQGFKIIAKSGLGVLRDERQPLEDEPLFALSGAALQIIQSAEPLLITKATTRSTVHRPVFMDYIGVKQFNDRGEVTGEMRFLGLYTSAAYRYPMARIPFIQRKVDYILRESNFAPEGYNSRVLEHILEGIPRDELFHADADELLNYALGVLQLEERQRIRLFIRHDLYGHFFSIVVFVPRELFSTEMRIKVQNLLMAELEGVSVDLKVQLSENLLVRLHLIIHTKKCAEQQIDREKLEKRIIELFRDWRGELKQALIEHFGEEQGNRLSLNYGAAFPVAYQENFHPRMAIGDIERFESLQSERNIAILLYHLPQDDGLHLRCKIVRRNLAVPLSEAMPLLENMGVTVQDEQPYEIRLAHGKDLHFWVHDFGLYFRHDKGFDFQSLQSPFEDLLLKAWDGTAENDLFNQLVISAQLNWAEIMVIRSYALYLKQLGTSFSQGYIAMTLTSHADVVRLLVELFSRRFNPELQKKKRNEEVIERSIITAIEKVSSLDEDRILRLFLELVKATVRTNFYQNRVDAEGIPYLSLKLEPRRISAMPEPRPRYEIFVYSPRVEGVHLRGGSVARGGLRWSDRPEDFRTEILGLMKAQNSKNAVIVPAGSKGGFVVKRSLEDTRKEGILCYQTFIRGLLDLTDNLGPDQEIIKPQKTVSHDGDDPYLVVAADKGTASFSDIANQISADYGFWLGDAFASGGSAGYDHKKMGITARGAWESVKRHFQELAIDINQPFSVVGIGGMGGDVFGNGMLLSAQIQLVATFNHRHIFLDPSPDPQSSWDERKRLFNSPKSDWSDYDSKLISQGGGVYLRSVKSIPLSKEVQKLLNIDADQMTPNDLIKAILSAPVDLLWNGGIGTYVKSQSESHLQVGDHSNDNLRINGSDLRCKVIGEGGNLGFTQRGRIEYAANGGAANTDSVDNSAGVDCSDHEVNLKILLNQIVNSGDLTCKQRNELLDTMQDEVAILVLDDNFLQCQIISRIVKDTAERLDAYKRHLRNLVENGGLDRDIEFLPTDEELGERKVAGLGLYRPEVAVLLAYTKLLLKQMLIKEGDLTHSYQIRELEAYFPKEIRKLYPDRLAQHPLSREIVTTQMVNKLVNRLGILFPFRMLDESGCGIEEMMRHFLMASQVFRIDGLWQELEKLEKKVSSTLIQELGEQVVQLQERSMLWFQRCWSMQRDFSESVELFSSGASSLEEGLLKRLPVNERQQVRKQIQHLNRQGVDKVLATRFVMLNHLFTTLDIIMVSEQSQQSIEEISTIYFDLDEILQLGTLRQQIGNLPAYSLWGSLARSSVRDDFHFTIQGLINNVLGHGESGDRVNARLSQWEKANQWPVQRYQRTIQRIRTSSGVSLEKIVVSLKELQGIVQHDDGTLICQISNR